ncbi:IclR family transcriptional regulator [Streptomyces mirabilis]|uniref:IclR family transcriptional regulator n=1 Tax=Streptomyces mirabilis TaxID=68239 RepID=UPI0036B1F454
MAQKPGGESNSHVGRVFGLMDLLGAETSPLTLSELARRADLPISTAHRLLGELVAWGGVERTESGTYRLGEKIWRLGVSSAWERELRRTALPFAHELAARTGAAVALSTMIGDRLVCIDTVRGKLDSIRLTHAGDELPLFATSAGKLLMSTVDKTALSEALRTRLERHTPYTQVLPRLVVAQVEAARQAGYAIARAESSPGQSSLSVPVATGIDRTPMALTALVPASDANLPRLIPPLREYAQLISREIANPG